MYEKPSQWLKRMSEKEPEPAGESAEAELPADEEPVAPETRAEYRSQLKHMVEKVLAAQKENPPSPEETLGEEKG